MSKMLLGAGAVSGIAPLLMGATGVPLPEGAPVWLPWLLAVLGPLLAGAGALGLRLVAAMLRAKAKALKADKDKGNDWVVPALEAGADVLEKKADQKENDK